MSHKLPFRGHPSSIFDRTNRKIHKHTRIKKTLFSTHTTLVPLVEKISTHVNHENLSEKWNFWVYLYKADFEDF